MMLRLFYLTLFTIATMLCASPQGLAQIDLLDTDALLVEETFTPSYNADIEAFNAISDETLIAEIDPENATLAPPPEELEEETVATTSETPPEILTDDKPESDALQSDEEGVITQEDLERYALVPQSVLDDAQDFFRYCEQAPSLKNHYQCTCWAKEYLDAAIDIGPDYRRDDVIKVINNMCLDIPRMAGITFLQCSKQSLSRPEGKTMEEYCECYGNEYATLIAEGALPMSSRKISAARSLAIKACL